MCPSSLVALKGLEGLEALAQPRSPSHFVASENGSVTPNLNPLTSPSPACRGEHKRVRDPLKYDSLYCRETLRCR